MEGVDTVQEELDGPVHDGDVLVVPAKYAFDTSPPQ